jgi:hypothetical protein
MKTFTEIKAEIERATERAELCTCFTATIPKPPLRSRS